MNLLKNKPYSLYCGLGVIACFLVSKIIAGIISFNTSPSFAGDPGKEYIVVDAETLADPGINLGATATVSNGSSISDGDWHWNLGSGVVSNPDTANPGLATFSYALPCSKFSISVGVTHYGSSGETCSLSTKPAAFLDIIVPGIQIMTAQTDEPVTISSASGYAPANGTVIVGQWVTLSVYFDDGGRNLADNAIYQWTKPTGAVDDYNPYKSANPITPVVSSDLTNNGATFYFTQPGTQVVKCHIAVNGFFCDIKATINVVSPTVTVKGQLCSVGPQVDSTTYTSLTLYMGWEFNQGLTGTASEYNAAPGFGQGNTCWLQTVDDWYVQSNAPGSAKNRNHESGLDVKFPYPFTRSGGAKVIDCPRSPNLVSADSPFTRQDSFSMYFMFKADIAGSIWVPLKEIDWWWGATATEKESVGSGDVKLTTWSLNDTGYCGISDGAAPIVLPDWGKIINPSSEP